jgi:hypothetical protein
MTHRVNILLDDGAWLAFQEIPRGERSKLVSRAIVKMVEAERRATAAELMDQVRRRIRKKTSNAELLSWISEDRNRSK